MAKCLVCGEDFHSCHNCGWPWTDGYCSERCALQAENERLQRLLSAATCFRVKEGPEGTFGSFDIYVMERRQRDDSAKWSINRGDGTPYVVATKSGIWEYEPIPSSRTERFLQETRWDTLGEAWEVAEGCRAVNGSNRAWDEERG